MWIISPLLTILFPNGFKCSFIWPFPCCSFFSMLPLLPLLLLPPGLLMLRPCPSNLRHTLVPPAVVHMTVRGPMLATPGLPLAFPCSCRPRVVCPWGEESPCPSARTRIQLPTQQTHTHTMFDWFFHLRASTISPWLTVTIPDRKKMTQKFEKCDREQHRVCKKV